MRVCIPLAADGTIASGWGRADRVAVVRVADAAPAEWQEYEVGWGRLHDEGPEGSHHARIARFLREHEVQMVVAGHMGPPMLNMLQKMGIQVELGAGGPARAAADRLARGDGSGEPRA